MLKNHLSKTKYLLLTQGDSGGPIICNFYGGENYLTGIVSFGPYWACGSSFVPGVYTKISSFEFIINQVLMEYPDYQVTKEYPGLRHIIL